MRNVLFVCTGNTCRSPMAEALLKQKKPGIEVTSAGLFAQEGSKLSPGSTEVLKSRGIEWNHQSRPVTIELLQWADVVLTMTQHHKQMLMMTYPKYEHAMFTLKEFVQDNQDDVWNKLKQAYTTLEEKKAKFLHEKEDSFSDDEAKKEALQLHVQSEIESIQQLESNLPNLDISDPFGGDISVYEKTLEEMEAYVERLVKKLDSANK
ncbi:low molecular weight protein arginine phosphatase [Pontibacillus litoralis]|uniref:Phosphotyrosine protein phosphatase I domain-containing protein n=1 Tax=Pontibacillus litoralis JSM 072002 TaxID=1385512 RepID=A0A0A5G323_9BACI|nr:low molecular weight protein arginine phosphatase [Pontibacillus litoralis]KGX86454.1 hypothetical protein N784_04685 [Pontibacillus litoralis JSM 072002]